MSLEKNDDMKNIDRELQEKLIIFRKYKFLKRQEEELNSKGKKLEWPQGKRASIIFFSNSFCISSGITSSIIFIGNPNTLKKTASQGMPFQTLNY